MTIDLYIRLLSELSVEEEFVGESSQRTASSLIFLLTLITDAGVVIVIHGLERSRLRK